jgi:hypothetical protein
VRQLLHTRRFFIPLICAAGVHIACVAGAYGQAHTASDLGHQILAAGLDPAECYHIRDIQIHQDDVNFYLTEGYLIFGKPVNGAPVSAVFTTDVEGGDAEVVLLPPDRAERRTLSAFTESPNLDEHFTQAIFFFTDGTAKSLTDSIRANPLTEKSSTYGLLMADRWNLAITGLSSSFETRMILDLLTNAAGAHGFFDASIRGRTLGDFDVVHDSRASEQIAVGRVAVHNETAQWETWTRFVAKRYRGLPPPPLEEDILSYKIDASLDASLAMHCVTRMRVRTTADSRDVLPLELDTAMHVVSAKVDGVLAEIYEHDSLHDGLVQNSGNGLLVLVPPQPLEPGSEHDIEIVHEGKVFTETSHQIYSVSARGTWYPGRGAQFANYDATFHYPRTLDLVSAGKVMEDHTENGIRTTHRIAQGKLRLLGVNLGQYARQETVSNGLTLEVSANREFEASLRPAQPPPVVLADPTPGNHVMRIPQVIPGAPPVMDPTSRVDALSTELLAALEFFRARFGEPPLSQIEVSPVTGMFGQGFAGMIYLPTVMYMNPANMPTRVDSQIDQAFMAELLCAHEAAHQWWGNVVTTDSYHHEWLMESLANYSAIMFLESRMGPRALEKALDVYRTELLMKGPDGATAESRGPVVEGRRLESSTVPGAANAVLYGKGTWIIHMIRRRLGDGNFMKMLAELRRRYETKTVTTDQFRELCAEFLPKGSPDPKLTDFFDQWVYDTGMPSLKLTYAVVGHKLTGTITQSDVRDDFTVTAPVEIRTGGAKPIVKYVVTGSEPVKFSVEVPGPGAKATLDPGWSILRR